MKLKPRDYQIACVDHIFGYFAKNDGNPLCALPTGTGKSIIIAHFLETVYKQYPTQRILILTHVKELIEQNHEKLMNLWPTAPAGIYSAGLNRRDVNRKVVFGGIASVYKKAHLFGHVDLVLIDEAHLVSPKQSTMYQKLLDDLTLRNPHLKVIGFTATPWRLGLGQLTDGGLFTDVCFDMTTMQAFNWLLDQGYLCRLVPKKPRTMLDVTGVRMVGGEFNNSDLQHAVDKAELTEAILNEALQHAHDREHWLVFATGIDHAEHVAEMLELMGVPSVVIHSKLTGSQRDERIADFKAGKVRAAVNVGVMTTGFDFPEIDLILMLRPTASTVLWIQMLGRGTRPVYAPGFDLESPEGRLAAIEASTKQNCLVLDFAGNTARLGPINDPVIPQKPGKKRPGQPAPVKECPHCETYNHTSVRFCEQCGEEFDMTPKLHTEASTNDLIKIDAPEIVELEVEQVVYTTHHKQDRPPIMKVMYYCGLRMFNEYICIEHEGYARKKAVQWWEKHRAPLLVPCPDTTERALELAPRLLVPKKLRVWINKEFPEILDHLELHQQEEPEGDPYGMGAQQTIRSDELEDDEIPF